MFDADEEEQLLKAAQAGDETAFGRLAEPVTPRIRNIVKRMIGHPEDTEDVLQEALLKAWTSIGRFSGRSRFSTWLTAIASNAAVDFLRSRKRWRPEAQIAYANLCATSEELSNEVISQYGAPDFSYEVREHISYCFTCVGRSLPPDELAALVLRDIVDMSAKEASEALHVSDSVLRHRLSAARKSMQERYDGLCSLVSKQGICHQCKGLQMIAPDERKGGAFPDLEDFEARLKVVRETKSVNMQKLHDVFWRNTSRIEEEGIGSISPDSGCGEDQGGH